MGRRRMSALSFEIFFYLGAALPVYSVFFDSTGSEIDALMVALKSSVSMWLKALVKGLGWILGAAAAVALAAYCPSASRRSLATFAASCA